MKISSSPNTKSIKKVSEEIDYSSKLIGREGRAIVALNFTRVRGIGWGIVAAFIILVVLPCIVKLCGL